MGGVAKKILNEVIPSKIDVKDKILKYLRNNSINYLTKEDWKIIDKIELEKADNNFVRKKLVNMEIIHKYLET